MIAVFKSQAGGSVLEREDGEGDLVSDVAGRVGWVGEKSTTSPGHSPPALCSRGWRKKKSKIRADAEDKAKVMIREEFQKLGPTRCVKSWGGGRAGHGA